MATPKRDALAEAIAAKSNGTLTLTEVNNGWPAIGYVTVDGTKIPVNAYVGAIGESHRKRDDERRFQNPGQGKRLSAPQGGIALLLGTVPEAPDQKDPVVVAMDAYRRLGLLTRFSMFMPVSVLEDADKGKFVEHTTTSAEEIFAFKASRLEDYLAKVVDVGSMVQAGPREATDQDEAHLEGSISYSTKSRNVLGVRASELQGLVRDR